MPAGSFRADTWYYYYMSLEGDQVKYYTDGKLVHEATVTDLPSESQFQGDGFNRGLFLADGPSSNNGKHYDDVMIYPFGFDG